MISDANDDDDHHHQFSLPNRSFLEVWARKAAAENPA
jgi:hypothetical protein